MPNLRSWRLMPMFSSKGFIVLALAFRYLSILSLFLYMIWGKGPILSLCLWLLLSQHHLLKRLLFSYWIALVSLLKTQLTLSPSWNIAQGQKELQRNFLFFFVCFVFSFLNFFFAKKFFKTLFSVIIVLIKFLLYFEASVDLVG